MMAQQSTVVGVFDDRQQADRAVDELRRAGFRDDQIGVAMRYDAGDSGLVNATDAADATVDETTPGRARSPGVADRPGPGRAGGPRGALGGHPRRSARRSPAAPWASSSPMPRPAPASAGWSAPWPGPASPRTRPTTTRANSSRAGRS